MLTRRVPANAAIVALLSAIGTLPAQAFVTQVSGVIFDGGVLTNFSACGAPAPASCEVGGLNWSNEPSASGSVSGGGYSSAASADLETGQLRVRSTGPDYGATATAEWEEILTFSGLAPGATAQLGVAITVDGSYRDGSSVELKIRNQSSDGSFMGMSDLLDADYDYTGNGVVDSSTSVSLVSFDAGDSCATCSSLSSGDWISVGPTLFQGEITIFGDLPEVSLAIGLFGLGFVEFENTVGIALDVPDGLSYTSSSGVFLTPIPLPAGLWLFASALGALLFRCRRL